MRYNRRMDRSPSFHRRALQQALGPAPVASLYFLRPGASYFAGPDELRLALAATRSRIDAGEFLADPEP